MNKFYEDASWAYPIFLWSIFLSIVTVHFHPGAHDDTVAIIQATTGQHFIGWPYGNSIAFHNILWFLSHIFGRWLDGYRLITLGFGLAAYMLLALAVWESALPVLGLAALLWCPITYDYFRVIRYDTMQLFLIALSLLWFTKGRHGLLAAPLGFLAGLCGWISLSGLFLGPALFVSLGLTKTKTQTYLLWTLGYVFGLTLFFTYWPLDQFVESMTLCHNLVHWGAPIRMIGLGMLNHPGYCISQYFMDLGWSSSGTGIRFDPFYILMWAVCVWNWKRPLSIFALCYSISHFLFSASRYPMLLEPLMLTAGLSVL